MDFSYTDDQQSLRELTRKILEDRATHDRLNEVRESEDRIDRELWKELQKANLLGLALEEAYGGMGFGLEELVVLLEEIGRAVAPVPVFPTLVLGALPIQAFGSDEQRQRWLPKVASGDAMLTAALAEVSGQPVTASHDGTGWRLNGERALVEAAHVAHRILVPAATDKGTALFLVDPAGEGVTLERVETTDQILRPHVKLGNARVPDAELLVDASRGEEALRWLRERAVLGLCAMQVGVAEKALQITAGYAAERQQFDRPIGSFQAVHARAGDAYVDAQAMRLSLLRATHLLVQGEDASEAISVAKFWASEGGARVTYAAQHLHGGIGVDIDYPIHRYYLWGRELGMHLGSGAAELAKIGAALVSPA